MKTFSITVQVDDTPDGGVRFVAAHAVEVATLKNNQVGVRFMHKPGDVTLILGACLAIMESRDGKGMVRPGRG